MKKKFDLFETLKNEGFVEGVNKFGCTTLKKEMTKEVEVAWYGTMVSSYQIEAVFNPDKTVLTVYYSDGGRVPHKEKTHMNDKRAYNAIHRTAELKGFAF